MGIKMVFSRRKAVGGSPLLRLVRGLLPVSDTYHGARFAIQRGSRWVLTPLAMALVMVEAADLLFAIDSIPAIFGITRDPFIVYTSNVCAILGLRSLYFLLAGIIHKFAYLKPALALILFFIGAKMLLVDVYHLPAAASLTVIGLILVIAVGLSLLTKRRRQATAEPTTKADQNSLPISVLR
jgi:tellurite resistance protein TerC